MGAGSKFFSLLGNQIVGLPISFICTEAENLDKWVRSERRVKRRSHFYSTKKCEGIISRYMESKYEIGSRENDKQESTIRELKSAQTRTGDEQGHLVEFEVHPYCIGRILFTAIKIEAVLTESNLK